MNNTFLLLYSPRPRSQVWILLHHWTLVDSEPHERMREQVGDQFVCDLREIEFIQGEFLHFFGPFTGPCRQRQRQRQRLLPR